MTVVPAGHADVLGTLPAAVDGTKIVVASFLGARTGGTALPAGDALHDARRFSKALRDAGV
ncbi:hypothetical protein [Streptomyces sp. NPDC093089]|uniref:hypothetical protein n=1 Tax=Streptomyces sp. NPDC093089 TaxID=3366024 RepID=UPI0038144AD0